MPRFRQGNPTESICPNGRIDAKAVVWSGSGTSWNGTERNGMEWNGTEQNGTERNGMEWNRMEASQE